METITPNAAMRLLAHINDAWTNPAKDLYRQMAAAPAAYGVLDDTRFIAQMRHLVGSVLLPAFLESERKGFEAMISELRAATEAGITDALLKTRTLAEQLEDTDVATCCDPLLGAKSATAIGFSISNLLTEQPESRKQAYYGIAVTLIQNAVHDQLT